MSDDNIEKEVFEALMQEVMAPAFAALPKPDFKGANTKLLNEVARYLRYRQGVSVAVIARQLGRGERWVYLVTDGKEEPESEHGWFMAIMDLFIKNYPQTLSPKAVRELLKCQHLQLGSLAIKGHLELYCALGRLEKVDGGYRAQGGQKIFSNAIAEENIKKMRVRLRPIPSICESFAKDDRGALFGALHGELFEEDLEDMAAEMKHVVSKVLAKYTARTVKRDDSQKGNLVQFDGLILLGQTPWLGPKKGENTCQKTEPVMEKEDIHGPTGS